MRSAGMPTNRPTSAAATIASAADVQNPKPAFVVRIATAYEPTPKKATWARLIWPPMPIASPRPTASRANTSAMSRTWMP